MVRPDRTHIFYYQSHIASTSYGPGITGVKGLLPILALVAYLVEHFWSLKSCVLTNTARKNATRSIFDRSGVWSNIASERTRALCVYVTHLTLTPFGMTNGNVCFWIWCFLQCFRSAILGGYLAVHNNVAGLGFLTQSFLADRVPNLFMLNFSLFLLISPT